MISYGVLGRSFEKPSCTLTRTIAHVGRFCHDPSAARSRHLSYDGLKFVPASHDAALPCMFLAEIMRRASTGAVTIESLREAIGEGGRGCMTALTDVTELGA